MPEWLMQMSKQQAFEFSRRTAAYDKNFETCADVRKDAEKLRILVFRFRFSIKLDFVSIGFSIEWFLGAFLKALAVCLGVEREKFARFSCGILNQKC